MKIVLFGSGNVAYNLAFALKENKHNIIQIIGRTEESTQNLAKKVDAAYALTYTKLIKKADIYFLAVNDDSIANIVKQDIFNNKLVVHLSGSISINVFKNKVKNYGVFYPLQTFSKNKLLQFKNIPICIEANTTGNLNKLKDLAGTGSLTDSIFTLNSIQRKKIHIAAVFASNFVNHMYTISKKYLSNNSIDFEILKPLIEQTTQKVMEQEPEKSQTGPAIRKDMKVIKSHLALLEDKPFEYEIYKILSEHIMKFYGS
ncbi:MAG: DUF2520 domain-containing protein [Chlorobi bacterium]|nr:DUF2520 domain-containing protein [Chlorobiota bacterium]